MIELEALGSLEVSDIKTGLIFNIGSGFTANQRKELWKNKENLLGKIVKYKYFDVSILNGSPSESFRRISEYWDNYLLHKNIDIKNLKPSDAAMMMVLFKIAREENKHKEDNIIDAIAYLVLYNNLIKEEINES